SGMKVISLFLQEERSSTTSISGFSTSLYKVRRVSKISASLSSTSNILKGVVIMIPLPVYLEVQDKNKIPNPGPLHFLPILFLRVFPRSSLQLPGQFQIL